MERNPLAADLDHILEHTRDVWTAFQGERLFLTGGTGFFGCWLLESFTWAVDRLGLDAQVMVLTRNAQAFQQKVPHLANHPAVHFWQGDVRSFNFPGGQFTHIIHAATESSEKLNTESPLLMLDTIVQGTRQVLDLAATCGATNLLLTSSGAVYGQQPPELSHIPEDYQGAPNSLLPNSAYGEGKRMAELLCSLYAGLYPFKPKIARCFAFVGPYLPLDIHFAIGNFIYDGMRGQPIFVKGNGTPFRSYLYAADLAIWLWKILIFGETNRPYNVGGEQPISIAELAREIANMSGGVEVVIARQPEPGRAAKRYVPSTTRAKSELGLNEYIGLAESIRRTMQWLSIKGR